MKLSWPPAAASSLRRGSSQSADTKQRPTPFPADKHQQEIVGQHERQHREHEQIQVSEEAIVTIVAVHVARREDVNQQSDKSDEESVNAAQAIIARPKSARNVPT